MPAWAIYIDGRYADCIEHRSRNHAHNRAMLKHAIRDAARVQVYPPRGVDCNRLHAVAAPDHTQPTETDTYGAPDTDTSA